MPCICQLLSPVIPAINRGRCDDRIESKPGANLRDPQSIRWVGNLAAAPELGDVAAHGDLKAVLDPPLFVESTRLPA